GGGDRLSVRGEGDGGNGVRVTLGLRDRPAGRRVPNADLRIIADRGESLAVGRKGEAGGYLSFELARDGVRGHIQKIDRGIVAPIGESLAVGGKCDDEVAPIGHVADMNLPAGGRLDDVQLLVVRSPSEQFAVRGKGDRSDLLLRSR